MSMLTPESHFDSIDEDELERLRMAYSPQLRAVLDTAKQQIRESGDIPHDAFWAEVEAETAE